MNRGTIRRQPIGACHGVRLVILIGMLGTFAGTSWGINNSNVTFSGVTTNFGGILTWPWDDTGTNNTLSILNGAVVIDTSHWFGGINSVANRNFVIISGNGSLWTNNAGNSFIGRMGGGNQVIVTNEGAWVSANALIGSLTASASNNTVLVTGANSLFRTTGDITLGGGGSGNSVTVTDQGTVVHGGFFTIGNVTSANSVLVTNGGKVYGASGFAVGALDNNASGSNNTLVVSGNGSVVTNGGSLFVGRHSAFNRMTISDQGMVVNNIGFIGSNVSAANSNEVLVTGSGSIWTNRGGMTLGGAGNGNRVTVTDAGLVFNGSTVTIGGSAGGANNSLVVSNGGRFIATAGVILGETDATTRDNSITVTGSGSVLGAATGILVGRYSTGNQLLISNGGVVTNGGTSYLGATAASSSNNSALVTGSGSVWSNASLIVGSASGGNKLTATDSGRVYASDITIGNSANAIGNQLIVTNGGSVTVSGGITLAPNGIAAADNLLKISGTSSTVTAGGLVVGAGGAGNQMIIEQGGSLSSGAGVVRIGNLAAASNCLVLVTGTGSVWSNGSSIVVGNVGNNNRLVVTDGGAVHAPFFTAGEGSGTGNSILVTDRGLVDTTWLTASAGNSISNQGGIYQFTTPTPVITAGRVFVTNGTVSFRGIATAPTAPVGNLSYQGNNTLRLNNASNTSVTTYTFDSIANTSNPSNYQRLVLMNGARWQSTRLRIGGGGALEGAGVVASTVVTNAGTISPGFSPGILEFTGDLDLESTSLLSMELAGTSAASYDQINVAGSLQFDGTLTVLLIDSFNPSGGDSFDLFDFSSTSGAFSTVNLPALGEGLFWDTSALYTLGSISVGAVPEPSVFLLTLAACAMFWRRRSRG